MNSLRLHSGFIYYFLTARGTNTEIQGLKCDTMTAYNTEMNWWETTMV